MQKHLRMRKWNLSIKSKSVLTALMMLVTVSAVWAQRSVTGKVTDANDNSEVIGATVLVKGTTRAAVTDVDGKYTISVPSNDAVLVFTYVGKTTQEIAVGGQSVVNVSLVDDAKSLEEVVVVAYGTRKKSDLTGSVVAITSKDFQQGNIQSSEQLLQGKVAGLQVTPGGGSAGGGSTIRIRGAASLNASNDPLIVIDGIPVEGNGIKGSENLLNTINPNDIESMSVLKDASAAALYGSRASNGVIIITTKKGTAGKTRFNFNTQFSVGTITDKVDMLTGDQVREIINANAAATGNNTYKNLLGTENTNWQDVIFRNSTGTDNNLSASGSFKAVPYRVSFGYSNQNGLLKTDNFQRTSGAINLSPKFFDNALSVNVNARIAGTQNRKADEGAVGAALRMDPTKPVYDAENSYGGYWEWLTPTGDWNNLAGRNPLAILDLKNDRRTATRFIGNVELDYKLPWVEGLSLKTNLALDQTSGNRTETISAMAASNYLTKGYYKNEDEKKINKLWDVSMFYEKDLPELKSKFDVLALHSYQDFLTEVYMNPAYSADQSEMIPNSTPAFATDRPQYRLDSYLGRINYTFDDTYLLTASLRRDASSKFSPENRVGYFPALAAAWKIKEGLFRDSKAVSELKFRVGWGVTGQQDFSNYYPYMARYAYGSNSAQYQFGDQFYQFLRPAAVDANIKWETTATTNVGLDFGFADNRITGTVEWFNKDTRDLLAVAPVAYGSTFDISVFTNVGNMTNKGVEFVLNTTPVLKSNLRWDLGFNITRSSTKIVSLRKQEDPGFAGIPVSGISGGTGNNIGLHMTGRWPYAYNVFQQVYDSNGKPMEGVYVDRNGDGQISDADRYLYQQPAPNTLVGLNTAVNYKKWTARASGHGMFGNYLYNNFRSERSVMRNLLDPVLTINNASTELLTSGFGNNQYLSDMFIENASFFRLDNINVGYYVGKVFGNASLSLNAGVNNVFVLTKYKGLDPENSRNDGVDNTIYPRPRIYTFGLNFDF
jgi:TonB-linked SusC/RagA family outer membrane protein